jgi:hypothetical protein
MDADHDSIHGKLAVSFAEHLILGRYEDARALLAPDLQDEWPASTLESEFLAMTDYGNGPANRAELMATMDTWPGRETGDIGWAYVSISGDGFVEAVTVVVSDASGMPCLRELEWGRP